jgi:hypothetical protein
MPSTKSRELVMAKKKQIRIYSEPAGGWGALKATGEALALQGVAISGAKTLLRLNQPEGFDCPGCAWPDPKHTSSFEFCENGAKAVAWEATVNRCTPAFFAAHSVSELSAWDETCATKQRASGCLSRSASARVLCCSTKIRHTTFPTRLSGGEPSRSTVRIRPAKPYAILQVRAGEDLARRGRWRRLFPPCGRSRYCEGSSCI